MKGGILKHLLHSKPSIVIRTLTPNAQFYSSLPNRPIRGSPRYTSKDEDNSEESFFSSLNFHDEGSTQTLNNTPEAAEPPSRPMRGERRRPLDSSEDLFSANIDRKITFDPKPGRPTRGDRRERPPRRESFDLGDDGPSREEWSAPKLDLEDQAVTFDKGDSGPSLVNNLKFSVDAENKQVSKDGEKTRPEPIPEDGNPKAESTDAEAIFSRMKKTGLIPNAVAMLDGLCKDGLIQEAMKLFGLMREKGTMPEVVIYTAVVEGYCKASKYDDAKRIFRKMQKNEIAPNAFSYGVIIQGLCKGRRWEDCVEFCSEMLDSGHSPNAMTFVGMVDGVCRDKGVEEAENMLKRLREGGLAVDEKAVRDHLNKRGPFSPLVWEAIFGKKGLKDIF